MRMMIPRPLLKGGGSFLIPLLLSMTFALNAAAHITLYFPVGGGVFTVGERIQIEWSIDVYHGSSNSDLYFSPDAGMTWQVIKLNVNEFQYSYQWLIPEGTTQTRVRVVQDNDIGLDYESIGNDFGIQPLASSVDEPGPGENRNRVQLSQSVSIQECPQIFGGAGRACNS